MKDISKILTEEQRTEIVMKAKELLASNEENFSVDGDNEKIDDNPYAAGVHDGIIDMLSNLGVNLEEINEEWYN